MTTGSEKCRSLLVVDEAKYDHQVKFILKMMGFYTENDGLYAENDGFTINSNDCGNHRWCWT